MKAKPKPANGSRENVPNAKSLRHIYLVCVLGIGITALYFKYRMPVVGHLKPFAFPEYKSVPVRPRSLGLNTLLELSTRPHKHYFKVKSSQKYKLCDTLEIQIEAENKKNDDTVQLIGGDFFWAWIYNKELRASAAADVIIDHKNGSYTAKFRLHWAGKTAIAVSLVHSAVEVSLLRYMRDNFPARCGYQGKFQSGNISTVTLCHINTDAISHQTTKADETFCNFTDEKTGFPWFCIKPDSLPCDTFAWHAVNRNIRAPFTEIEHSVSTRPQLVSYSTSIVNVEIAGDKNVSNCEDHDLPQCSMGSIAPRPSNSVAGFYYQDQWHSLVCNNSHFQVPEALSKIRRCLQNHTLNFWGDSTVRQWYEYFANILKNTLDEQKAKNAKFGPHVAVDKTYNITFHYLHHGYPIRNSWTPVQDIHYVPNMIDEIKSGGNEIILLTLWAHFTPSNLQFYRHRWQAIKDAILRLKLRNPDARIIIKSANTREPTSTDCSSWYAGELDKVMREMMSGMDDVTIIDVWDMTIGHRTGYHIHPTSDVISQEIDMVLSFLCHNIN